MAKSARFGLALLQSSLGPLASFTRRLSRYLWQITHPAEASSMPYTSSTVGARLQASGLARRRATSRARRCSNSRSISSTRAGALNVNQYRRLTPTREERNALIAINNMEKEWGQDRRRCRPHQSDEFASKSCTCRRLALGSTFGAVLHATPPNRRFAEPC